MTSALWYIKAQKYSKENTSSLYLCSIKSSTSYFQAGLHYGNYLKHSAAKKKPGGYLFVGLIPHNNPLIQKDIFTICCFLSTLYYSGIYLLRYFDYYMRTIICFLFSDSPLIQGLEFV